jgi:hypothetical protein
MESAGLWGGILAGLIVLACVTGQWWWPVIFLVISSKIKVE